MKAVELHELADVWQWARPGVEQLLREYGERLIAEDVYFAIRSGQAWMFTIEDAGFVVLQKHTDVDGSAALFVWLTWGERGELKEHYERSLEELNEMAKKAKCRVLRMWSPREGWQRVGWKLTHHVYEREVV